MKVHEEQPAQVTPLRDTGAGVFIFQLRPHSHLRPHPSLAKAALGSTDSLAPMLTTGQGLSGRALPREIARPCQLVLGSGMVGAEAIQARHRKPWYLHCAEYRRPLGVFSF